MKLPPYGICLPCRLVKVRDGDTVEIRLISGLKWVIRLLDCWCAEVHRGTAAERATGRTAKEYARALCEEADQLSVWVPAPQDMAKYCRQLELADPPPAINLLGFLTFDRIPGHVYVSTQDTLSELMCRAGYATPNKLK